MTRVVAWFSCGAASAVATKLALAKWPDAVIVRCGIAEEHPDNERFMRECSEWFGAAITVLTNRTYIPGDPDNPGALTAPTAASYGSIFEVFRKERYLVGPSGAHCTKKLKKALREAFERPTDLQVFGYTCEEQERVDRFIDANPLVRMVNPLIDANVTKADCLALLERQGIALPMMYRLGYANNNCVGCVKGGVGYWNKIRVDFPEAFERMAQMEEYLGRSINRVSINGKRERVTLRQLPPDAGDFDGEQPSDCGPFCLMAEGMMRGGIP